jgi:drug/metabolite transporter (DMT)-like permease
VSSFEGFQDNRGGEVMKPMWLLLISVVSATSGQICFKKGVFMTGEISLDRSLIEGLLKLLFNPFIFSGLVLYVISTILWLIALSKTTLNFVYPFTALVFVLVMLSARILFLEHIPTLRYFGIVLICLGFLLSSLA